MITFTIVVAMATNRAIGSDNKLLWHLPNDLKHFKALTIGKTLIMGRKTFESIGKPLPKRENIVLTSNTDWMVEKTDNLKIFNNIDEIIAYLEINKPNDEIMIIGGGQIYEQFLTKFPTQVNKIHLTLVHTTLAAEIYFPDLDDDWYEASHQTFTKDKNHLYDYEFIELVRKELV